MSAKARPSKAIHVASVAVKSDDKFIPQVEPKIIPKVVVSDSVTETTNGSKSRQEDQIFESNESALDKKNKKLYFIGLLFTLLIVLSAIGLYIFSQVVNQKTTSISTLPIPTLVVSPTPAFDRNQIIIEVFNGSGVGGAAGKAARKLETLGYSQIVTGNTKLAKGNKLFVQNGYRFSDQLLFDFKNTFTVSTISGDLLESTATARIIIGK
jgi:hypothetical protein